jgi:hypothetical protein
MGYDLLRAKMEQFDTIISGLGIKFGKDCSVKKQLDLVSEFLGDEKSLNEEQNKIKWDPRFKELYDALIVAERFSEAVIIMKDQKRGPLKRRLSTILGGSLTQDFEPEQAKDYFYELEMASSVKIAGFGVELREPDFVISSSELRGVLGVACKYPSSTKQIHVHISKGYKQITNQKIEGFVAIGMDQILFAERPKYLDFTKSEGDPQQLALNALNEIMVSLVKEREKDFPSEKPLDGSLLSLMVSGIHGSPAGITTVAAFMLQCAKTNPMIPDMRIVVAKLNALKA